MVEPEEKTVTPEETPRELDPAWQRVLLARHPKRPHSLDYIQRICNDFHEIHGDRLFGDDAAIVTGFGDFDGRQVLFVMEQKGRTTKEKIHRNFGMPKPEGYRKALRAMQLAAKFGRPIVTFLDTAGAYPGIDAEERGQAEAIARNMLEMSRLRVPIVAVITGEGGSGGALGLAVGDRVLILDSAIYSVIPPEGCAAILWRDAAFKAEAAAAMRISASDVRGLGCVDDIVPEPPGGAHADPSGAAELLAEKLRWHLNQLTALPLDELLRRRYDKFRNIAQFYTTV